MTCSSSAARKRARTSSSSPSIRWSSRTSRSCCRPRSPSELQDIEERMRSRLGSGLVADIHSSTYELRLSILQTKAESARVPVPVPVLEFLAHKISTNIRELEGALNRVVAHGQL